MAEITLRLIYNRKTGRKDIYIDFESEPDALPIEHEQAHRKVVQDLLGKGILTEDELGEVVVRRVQPGGAASPREETGEGERKGQSGHH